MARLAFDLTILRILLVEDDTFARELEMTALQQLGISRVTIARDGAEALDVLERGKAIDMIVSDWNMPNFNGLELFNAVRERWPGIAFLMLTSNESLGKVMEAITAGVDGYVIIPFSLDKLRECLQLALISRVTGGVHSVINGGGRGESDELIEVTSSIRDLINTEAPGSNGQSADALKESNELAIQLSNQLTGLVKKLDGSDRQQLDVVKLHLDCMRAVLSGRQDLLDHETRNMIVDGLSLAADLASE